jgi:hypothetical protein
MQILPVSSKIFSFPVIYCRLTTSLCRRAQFIANEFEKLGLAAATQRYTFTSSTGVIWNFSSLCFTFLTMMAQTTRGMNAYGILSAPRSSGNEAMVISASWLSRAGGDTLNLRGVSLTLALASSLRRKSTKSSTTVSGLNPCRILFLVEGYHLRC